MKELLWKILPWRRADNEARAINKETCELLRFLRDQGYEVEVTTFEDRDNGLMACFCVWKDYPEEKKSDGN